jgi:hypothetical protein
MTENALIAAIGKAVAHTKENCTNVDTEAEVLSNYLVKELSALPRPDDPTKDLTDLKSGFAQLSPT